MSKRVLIVGAGLAGLAAAYAARKNGRAVVVISSGAGASALGSGAIDDIPWEERLRASRVTGSLASAHALSLEVKEFSDALGLWELPSEPSTPTLLATAAGRLRPARGRDKGLLDLGSIAGARVLLPRAPRAGWDADAIAATLTDDPLARRLDLSFEAIDAPVLRFADEARIGDGDLAMRHDDPSRVEWLAARLTEALTSARSSGQTKIAFLLGSWLGASSAHTAALSARVGVPVGEVLFGVGSAAGLRFEAAQTKLLSSLGAELITDRVRRVETKAEGVTLELTRKKTLISGNSAVLAIGGLAGGGVVYAPPEHAAGEDLPARGAVPYALSLEAPVTLSLGAGRLDIVASMQGPELDTSAWPVDARPSRLEDVGVFAPEGRAAPHVYCAGDLVAGRPRTSLEAVASGLRAGRST